MSGGYHLTKIKKGKYGNISKIQEELDELKDAKEQGSSIMELVELSDLVGAIEGYLEENHPNTSLNDLIIMNKITKRAFGVGDRK